MSNYKKSRYEQGAEPPPAPETSLVPVVTGEMGQTLIAAAREAIKKRLTEKCVGEVESLLNLIEQTKRKIEHEQKMLVFFQNRLLAIEAGAITLDAHGQIEFEDKSLQNIPQSFFE